MLFYTTTLSISLKYNDVFSNMHYFLVYTYYEFINFKSFSFKT